MKSTNKTPNGTSYWSNNITATVTQLKAILGEPVFCDNDGSDKVNFEWNLETDNGDVFTVYDWKEYRPISEDEIIVWHIGGINGSVTIQAQSEVNAALTTQPKEPTHITWWKGLNEEEQTKLCQKHFQGIPVESLMERSIKVMYYYENPDTTEKELSTIALEWWNGLGLMDIMKIEDKYSVGRNDVSRTEITNIYKAEHPLTTETTTNTVTGEGLLELNLSSLLHTLNDGNDVLLKADSNWPEILTQLKQQLSSLQAEMESWKKEHFETVEQASETVKELQAENKALNEQLENGANQYAYAIVENERLREALQPLVNLSDAVFIDTRKDKEGVLYAFNAAEITYNDLRAAKAALQNK